MTAWRAGSSHSGLGEWLWQRLSALYITGFLVYALVAFSVWPIRDYQAWLQWFNQGAVRIALGLLFLSLLVHAWIGLRSVFLDYLKPIWLRLLISLFAFLGVVALLLWMAMLLFRSGV